MDKIGEELCALRRVDDLGVELDAIEFPALIGDRRKGRALGGADDVKAGRQLGDPVAMAHPHLVPRARIPCAREELIADIDVEEGAAEFAMVRQLDLAAKRFDHRLLPVADAEYRQAEVE